MDILSSLKTNETRIYFCFTDYMRDISSKICDFWVYKYKRNDKIIIPFDFEIINGKVTTDILWRRNLSF